MKIIYTNKKDKIIVDDDLYNVLNCHKWFINHNGYAVSVIKRKTVRMQRLIMNAPKGKIVDHINRNRLDNRKINLRLCTHLENNRNCSKDLLNTSGFKGVFSHGKNWRARITVNYKTINLGTYKTKIDAAVAYNFAAINYHGEFANINEI